VYVLPVEVLQVTPNRVPRELSSSTRISLLAVTAEVFTTIVVAGLAIATAPAEAELHTAGEADEAQLVAVLMPVAILSVPEPLERISPAASADGTVQV
jgi:hypothetical protein